jgi:hypothetical protein
VSNKDVSETQNKRECDHPEKGIAYFQPHS